VGSGPGDATTAARDQAALQPGNNTDGLALARATGSCSSTTTRPELLREHRKAQVKARMAAGPARQDNDLIFCQADGWPWNPDHVSKRFKKLAAQAGVPVIKLHTGGRHTGNSLMRDARVDQEVRRREVGHAGRDINDRHTHVLIEAHLAAAELTAALIREAGKTAP
jgi:hypothetical protein